MSRSILIYGQSGAGKTTSCRNLDPKATFYIDCDGKGLSWRGWRKQYGRDKQNYFVTDIIDANNSASVQSLLRTLSVNEKYRHIKNIVVDGISTLMIKEEFRRRNEKGYDKYQDLAAYIYETADLGNKLRDDLTVIFIGHVDSDRDVNGNEVFAQVKTSGQKLKKIVLESLFTTVTTRNPSSFVTANFVLRTFISPAATVMISSLRPSAIILPPNRRWMPCPPW